MSEYQYYEFVAIDRPLSGRQLGEVHALSTRAQITPTSFVNTDEWGNFRGDPRVLMERYYDAFPAEYDRAVDLLGDLQDVVEEAEFGRPVVELRVRHARKPSLMDRFDRAGL